ncbi:MAG: SusC/RagA family TonB-linked outer membrane protein [Chitinophagaceae bacterium]|nr:SusC/RagA family TonB-linked outer membrane protein [Chitinophagaceae bacterium]
MYQKFKILILFNFILYSVSAQSSLSEIRGTITSGSTGQPLSGASVTSPGFRASTLSDENGRFHISIPENNVLVISYVGFKTKELDIRGAGAYVQVTLEPDDGRLEEVVVTALGIARRKRSLGYAVQEVKARELSEAKEPNLVNALSGRVAGVRITNSQGDMGSSRIIIRGETSISGNNQPLFIVDGVPVDNSQLGAGGSRDFANAISDINANDIESISVLKGPNAAALYGSRAAAGVILINTKTGKSNQGLGITVSSNVSFENLLTLPAYQNAFGQGSDGKFSYVDGKGGGINDGTDESWGPRLDGRLIPQFYSNGEPVPFVAHPDNVRDFFRTGNIISNGISVSNSTEQFDYRLSFNNFKQNGVIPNSSQDKNNFSLNTTLRLTRRLSFNVNANYLLNNAANLPGAGGKRATSTMLQFTWFGRQVDISRLKNYLDEDGNTFNWNNSYYSNPYWVAYENTVQQKRARIIGSAGFNYKITDHLDLNFRSGNDYYNDRRKLKVAYGTNGTPYGSYEEESFTVNENNTEATLNFNKDISHNLSINLLGGGNIRSKYYEENDQVAPRLAVAKLYSLTNSRDPLQSSNDYYELKTYSLFGSAQIGFKNYAFLNITGRNDWSSTLPPQNRSFFYPSFNGSVILTEAFRIKSDFLSYAKLRGGWSQVGKEANPYQLVNTYLFGAPYGASPQLLPSSTYMNRDLKPETTSSTELGTEVELSDSRIRFDISLYNSNSYNQILAVDVSPSTGYRSKLLNAGKINNRGVEIQLGLSPVRGVVKWDINLNYAANRSQVVELDKEGLLENYVIGSNSAQVIASVGQPYGTLFGNAFLRDAKGNIVVDNTGTPQRDPNKKVLGKFPADWIGGISNTIAYGNLKLSVLVDASIGGSIYNGTYATGTYTGVLASTLPGRGADFGGLYYYYPNDEKTNGTSAAAAGAATGPNGETLYDDGIIFKGVTADGKTNETILPAQSYYKSFRTIDEANVFDASYVKLREIILGYDLPARLFQKIGLTGASVSLAGRSLLILYKNVPDIDPETAFNTGNAQGLESLSLPTTRSYGFNIVLKF